MGESGVAEKVGRPSIADPGLPPLILKYPRRESNTNLQFRKPPLFLYSTDVFLSL